MASAAFPELEQQSAQPLLRAGIVGKLLVNRDSFGGLLGFVQRRKFEQIVAIVGLIASAAFWKCGAASDSRFCFSSACARPNSASGDFGSISSAF